MQQNKSSAILPVTHNIRTDVEAIVQKGPVKQENGVIYEGMWRGEAK